MARPVQLRYNDATNGETVIGTYLTDDNLIQQGDMKNSGSGEYTQMEIIGDKQLKDNLPIDYSEYGQAQNGQNEPEILVYVYDDNGNFTLRDRVFPEKQGSLDDQGKYRNDELWGFQKWVGRQRVTGVSEQNSSLTTIVDALLPAGYTAVTPVGDTVPTLENYTFNGKIDKALRDLIRDYQIKIWFTSELDGGDYVVKVESKGFGGVVETVTFDDERQDEGYQIIDFDEEDKTDVVNKVEVAGVLPDGTKVDASTSGSLPVTDSSSISSHGERYLYRHIGYLNSEQQAIDTANDLLNPDPSARARIAIPFQDQNILNASIDIKDDRYGIDAVYTAVQQRDFFTEGKTEVVLGFEKNRSEERRNLDRDTDEQQHRLFPESQSNVNAGGQDLSTGGTGNTPSDTAVTRNPDGVVDANIELGEAAGSSIGNVENQNVTNLGLQEVISFSWIRDGVEFRQFVLDANPKESKNGYLRVQINQYSSGSSGSFITWFDQWIPIKGGATNETRIPVPGLLDESNIEGDVFVECDWAGDSSTEQEFDFDAFAVAETEHTHNDDFATSDAQHGGATIDNIIAVDTTNEIFTVSGDQTGDYSSSNARKNDIRVRGSTGNDGTYSVSNVALNGGDTEITVNEDITDSTADGVIIPEENHGLTGETLDKILNIIAATEDKTDR